MKVAFVSQPGDEIVPPVDGGNSLVNLTYQIARRLVQKAEIIIYAKQGRLQEQVQKDAEGVEYRRVSDTLDRWLKPVGTLEGVLGLHDYRRPLFASRSYYSAYARQVAKDIRRQQCDVVHILNFSQFVPVIRAYNPNAGIVLHMECEWLTQLDQETVAKRLKDVDLMIGCSDYITDGVRARFPWFATHCCTIYNGVDVSQFVGEPKENSLPEKERIKHVLYVGRISPEKGLHVLLKAFRIVTEQYAHVQLDIVGPPSVAPYEFIVSLADDEDENVSGLADFYGSTMIEKIAARLINRRKDYVSRLTSNAAEELPDKVHFHGSVTHSRLRKFYRDADVFVFPSVWNEPFGMPIIEAMACEVPVVATRGGGIPEILESGSVGLLVDRGDVDGLAGALLHLLGNEALCAAMGKAGRNQVQRFAWDRIAAELYEKYRQLEASCGMPKLARSAV